MRYWLATASSQSIQSRLDPGDEVAWYRLSQAERATGNREAQQEARAMFQELHSTKPLHKPAVSDEITPQKLGPDAPE